MNTNDAILALRRVDIVNGRTSDPVTHPLFRTRQVHRRSRQGPVAPTWPRHAHSQGALRNKARPARRARASQSGTLHLVLTSSRGRARLRNGIRRGGDFCDD